MYAYAGFRLMPVMQQFFRSITKLKYSVSGTESIIAEFELKTSAHALPALDIKPLPFERTIALDHIVYTYPGKDHPVINDISLEITANSLVGFCGTTGSGKTTTVDIILGLLLPDSGTLSVDGHPISQSNLNAWQKNIGYVPQNIYLSNASISSNIAFGIPEDEIDFESVKRAARMAQIHDFIESDLDDGYDTKVGERGICLSGGQRQRIGIARALYTNPSVLVMDEATSALDNKTEADVMSAINNLAGKENDNPYRAPHLDAAELQPNLPDYGWQTDGDGDVRADIRKSIRGAPMSLRNKKKHQCVFCAHAAHLRAFRAGSAQVNCRRVLRLSLPAGSRRPPDPELPDAFRLGLGRQGRIGKHMERQQSRYEDIT